MLRSCAICPRKCGADRTAGNKGYCGLDDGIYISSICIHKGEEPPVSGPDGICNVFFSHCNIQCSYCQNFQISDNKTDIEHCRMNLETALGKITEILDKGIPALGFVSPFHQVPQMLEIIDELHRRSYDPVIVYNTNGYDTVETLQMLEGIVDVYLPDLKYSDPVLAKELSDAPDYPQTALNAVKEMYRQKGHELKISSNGCAESGLIVRHLVLPGQASNSIGVLSLIAKEISPEVFMSVMSQYYPPKHLSPDYMNYRVTAEEYRLVTEEMEKLGLYNGWLQEFESHMNYRPDFDKDHPFEDK